VGDHEQVSPSAVGKNLDVVTDLIRQHLEGIPGKELYDGRLSVYHLARQSFGGTICLREHFRCVPEIIQFSNRLSYEGRIKPLRDQTSSHLRPSVVPFRVNALPREGKVNQEEVLAVASLLVAAVRHPAYANQTFGAISLLGDDQAYEIDAKLRQKLLPEEYDSRRIICGNSLRCLGFCGQSNSLFCKEGEGQFHGSSETEKDGPNAPVVLAGVQAGSGADAPGRTFGPFRG